MVKWLPSIVQKWRIVMQKDRVIDSVALLSSERELPAVSSAVDSLYGA